MALRLPHGIQFRGVVFAVEGGLQVQLAPMQVAGKAGNLDHPVHRAQFDPHIAHRMSLEPGLVDAQVGAGIDQANGIQG